MKKRTLKTPFIFLFTAVFLFICQIAVFAADMTSLTLHYQIDSAPINGAKISLYKIAMLDSNEKLIPTEAFKRYQIDFSVLHSTEEWDVLAETLSAYVAADSIPPDLNGVSGSDGIVQFDLDKKSAYLAITENIESNGNFLKFAPALIAAYGSETENNISVYPKGETSEPTHEKIDYKAVKLWKDNDGEFRPENIEIAISQNGRVIYREILSDNNDWSYFWTAEDDGSAWSVTESNVPEKYAVAVEKIGNTFVLTNNLTTEENPSYPPASPPQTGDTPMNTYIILAIFSGFGLMICGLFAARARGYKNNEKTS